MKRPKKCQLTLVEGVIKTVKAKFTCPHCRTGWELHSFDQDILMMKCGHCGNPIDFRTDSVKKSKVTTDKKKGSNHETE